MQRHAGKCDMSCYAMICKRNSMPLYAMRCYAMPVLARACFASAECLNNYANPLTILAPLRHFRLPGQLPPGVITPLHLPRSRWLKAFMSATSAHRLQIPWTEIAAPAQMGCQVGRQLRVKAGIEKSPCPRSHGLRAMTKATISSVTWTGRTTEPRPPIRSGQVQVRRGRSNAMHCGSTVL